MQKFIAELLALQGYIVYRAVVQEDGLELFVGRPQKQARCPVCQRVTRSIHSRGKKWRSVLHGRCGPWRVFLRLRPRRFRCKGCGKVFTERFPGLPRWSRVTDRACQEMLEELGHRSFRGTAQWAGVSPGVLRRLLDRWGAESVDLRAALGGLPELVLGIDEHSFRGQQMMITVTCVWPKRQVLAILPNDQQKTLRAFLQKWPEDLKARVRGVCMDLNRGWWKVVTQELPWAQVIADRFHVLQDANRRVEEARRIEQQVTGQRIARWPLVKNEEDLTERQAEQLAEIRKKHRNVAHFHWVKEQLRDVYREAHRHAAEKLFDRILVNAACGPDAALVQWARTLKRWKEPILAYYSFPVSNGYTEGVHTKIKLLKRLSYGFRNPHIYVKKMLLAFVPLAWLTLSPHLLT